MFIEGLKKGIPQFVEWALYIFIATFPFLLYRGFLFNGTSTRSVNLIILMEIIAVAVGIMLWRRGSQLRVTRSPILLALAVFFAIMVVTAFTGVDPSVSFWSKATRSTGIYYFLHAGLFLLLLTWLFRDQKKFRTLLSIFVVSSAIFSVAALLGQDGYSIIFVNKPWSGFTFGNSTFAGMYLYAACMASIYLAAAKPKAERQWWDYLLPVLILLNPYLLDAKFLLGKVNPFSNPLGIIGGAQASSYTVLLSIAGLAIIGLISLIRNVRIRRVAIWTAVVAGAAVAAVAMQSFFSDSGALRAVYLRGASNDRPIVWELSKKGIAERPALGWGTDNFDIVFQRFYDNRLLEQKNGGEAWFDRAHNIFFDQAIETGYIGLASYLLIYLAIIGSMLFVLFRAQDRRSKTLGAVLLVYAVGHLMELQTAFDTTISFISLAIMTAAAIMVFHETRQSRTTADHSWRVPLALQYVVAAVLVLGSIFLFFRGTVHIARAESANGAVRLAGSGEKRLRIYPILFSSPMDEATFLLRTFTDLKRGVMLTPSVIGNPQKQKIFAKEFDSLAQSYVQYLETHPDDYRSHLALANIYLFERVFEVDRVDEAERILDEAVALVPQAPQAYWLKAVGYLYQRKFDLAKAWAAKGVAVNPNIEESKRLSEYINESIRTFPDINIYSFKQL